MCLCVALAAGLAADLLHLLVFWALLKAALELLEETEVEQTF